MGFGKDFEITTNISRNYLYFIELFKKYWVIELEMLIIE